MTQRTFNFTNERISVENLRDGRHVVKETPGGTKILAYVSDGAVVRYEAEDSAGNRQQLLGISPDSSDAEMTPDGLCEVCTYDATFDTVFCYTVLECPPPLETLKGPH